MSANTPRHATESAPARAKAAGLDALAEALKGRYPDIKPIRFGEFLELHPKPSGLIRHLVWDVEAGAPRWYSGPDHGVHLKADPAKAAAQIAVLMDSAYA